jgi:phage-related protein
LRAKYVLGGTRFRLYALEEGGRCEFDEFADTWRRDDPDEWARLFYRLERLGEVGASRRRTQYNYLGDGLFEAKTKGGLRVLFFYHEGQVILLSHGFRKKTPKTPPAEIAKANAKRSAFLRAVEDGMVTWDKQRTEGRQS